jgi:hypothetical protein
MKQEEDFDPCAPEDARRKKNGFVSRHRVRHPKTPEPTTVEVQTELELTPAPATDQWTAYGFATRTEFMNWRASVLKQRDPGPMRSERSSAICLGNYHKGNKERRISLSFVGNLHDSQTR